MGSVMDKLTCCLLVSPQVISDPFVTLWTVTYQAPPSMGFSREEYWSGLPFPSPGYLPDPGIEPTSPALAGGFFTTEPLVAVLLTQSCPNLCNPMDYSSLGSSVHGILQARILEWLAITYSSSPSQPRDQTQVSCTAGRFFTISAKGKPLRKLFNLGDDKGTDITCWPR